MMVTPIEIGLLIAIVVIIFVIYKVFETIKPLIINAVVGLIVLILANLLGFGVKITGVVILIVAFGGIPAALVVILLSYFGILFEPVSYISIFI